jgi:hypothetical protein
MDKKKADRRLENLASLGLDTRSRPQGRQALKPRGRVYSKRSSTAPVLALDAFFAKLRSTPRV